jgi:hypothetical protein
MCSRSLGCRAPDLFHRASFSDARGSTLGSSFAAAIGKLSALVANSARRSKSASRRGRHWFSRASDTARTNNPICVIRRSSACRTLAIRRTQKRGPSVTAGVPPVAYAACHQPFARAVATPDAAVAHAFVAALHTGRAPRTHANRALAARPRRLMAARFPATSRTRPRITAQPPTGNSRPPM